MAPKRQASLKATAKLTTRKTQQRKQSKTDQSQKKLDEEGVIEELKQFDLVSKYGPCVGITRRERWDRAEKFGKQPPQTIKAYLDDQHLEAALGTHLTESLWYGVL